MIVGLCTVELFIPEGRLKGIQNIPLDAAAECQKEQEA